MQATISIASPPEGGGQILRSSLALSILSGQAVQLLNLRAGRSKSGLQAQHLQAVKAAATICDATVEGAISGSQTLFFKPGTVRAGNYRFAIGTAGATSLVLQTILLPLSLAQGKSTVSIEGGTHVAWSPSFDYLDRLYLPFLQRLGYTAELTLEQAGFYPQGGGCIRAVIHPVTALRPLQLLERGALLNIRGASGIGNLDEEIGRRQKLQALRRLDPHFRETKIKTEAVKSSGKGSFLMLLATFEHSQACFTALGAPGKRAERVADEAVAEFEAFIERSGAVDQYLADQLLLPLALAPGISQFTTTHITEHLQTNAEVIRQFGVAQVEIKGEMGQPGSVRVTPGYSVLK